MMKSVVEQAHTAQLVPGSLRWSGGSGASSIANCSENLVFRESEHRLRAAVHCYSISSVLPLLLLVVA